MVLDRITVVETGVAVLVFAAVFLVKPKTRPVRSRIKNPHTLISFGAGMSAAYVFMHMMPELHAARRTFVESVSITLRYEGMAIYFLSLVGFLVFYGLDHLRDRLDETTPVGEVGLAFRLQVGGFAVYVWLMSYLMLHHLGASHVSTPMYALAMSFHFLALDYTLDHEHEAAYERLGRYVLAGAAVLGWLAGLLFTLPHHILALLVAFISGAIIMTSTVMELSAGKDSRHWPFISGGILYGLVLLPLG